MSAIDRTSAIGRNARPTTAPVISWMVIAGMVIAWMVIAAQGSAGAVTFDCVINPSMTLKIGTPVATTVESIAVDRGDKVRKGDVVARLESSVEEADLAVSTARAADSSDIASHAAKVDFARGEVARAESLLVNNNIPRQKVDELRTNLRVAQSELQTSVLNHRLAELEMKRAQALRDQKIIRSPIDGVVTRRMLGPGEYAHQDTQILEIAAISPLNIEAYPPVRYFGAITLGAAATVIPDAPAGSRLAASVGIIDNVFDAASGTFGIRLMLPNEKGTLPAGLRCHVTIDIAER